MPKALSFSFALILLSTTLSGPIYAAEPRPAEPFLFGVGIHLGQSWNRFYATPQKVEEQINKLGTNTTRDDLSWDIRSASSLRDIPSQMGKINYALNHFSAQPLLILTGNADEIPEQFPETESSLDLYVAYAKQAAKALKDLNPIFEIWNEWNLGAMTHNKTSGPPDVYVKLAKAVYPELKKIMPHGLVLAGAVSENTDWKWAMKAIDLGLMDYADGFSVHAYNYCERNHNRRSGNEIVERMVSLHNKIEAHKPGSNIPLYLTEVGWPTHDDHCGGVADEQVAANVAQLLFSAQAFPWFKGIWIYELLDERQDSMDREGHFGLIRSDGSTKPAYCMTQAVWSYVKDAQNVKLDKTKDGIITSSFSKDGKFYEAVWKSDDLDKRRWVQIPAGASILSLCGSRKADAGEWVPVEVHPLLIKMPAVLPLNYKN